MATLIAITGPIAAGKNTLADRLAELFIDAQLSVVVADVDDVAAMVARPGAGTAGLWFAAHQAHGAMVGQWMRSAADVVIAVGPVYTRDEQDALFGALSTDARVCRVLIDAPMETTWSRVTADRRPGMSAQRAFHEQAYERFRRLEPSIPRDLRFNSAEHSVAEIVATVHDWFRT